MANAQAAAAKAKAFYSKYEKFSAPAVFAVGFAWDALTLRRIDNLFDNLCLLGYLAVLGAVVVLTLRMQEGAPLPDRLRRFAPRFPWVAQFCFGGLFSSYVVFYFKSASFTRTAFFFLALVALLVGNEFLEDRLQNRTLLAALYSFCCFTFLAFFLPVLLRAVSPWVFVLAGVVGATLTLGVFALGICRKGFDRRRAALQVGSPTLGVFLLLNALYFTDLIPPVPLALKTGHPYHAVAKKAGGYEVRYVAPSILRFWRDWDDPFYWTPGEAVYCHTAIFAPEGVQVRLVHVWSRQTPSGWVATDRMAFGINGGRDGGYRWFSRKRNVSPGEWRVEVKTASGQTLGEIDFTIVQVGEHPRPMRTELVP
ncbi:MAG: DUF2914 domain-containing protein [Acidobacteriota bacterium]|jgi:hypothetical protein|nr:DUF2914 domain-containing protein [Acidobacteriota bacterium]